MTWRFPRRQSVDRRFMPRELRLLMNDEFWFQFLLQFIIFVD